LFVSQHDYAKTTQPIFKKNQREDGTLAMKDKRLDFVCNPDHATSGLGLVYC